MKTKNISFLVLCLLLSALLGFYACEKPEPVPSMPPLTFEGKNTFGCYINGDLFVAKYEPAVFGGCGGAGGEYNLRKDVNSAYYNDLTMSGSICSESAGIQIKITDLKQIDTGVYNLEYPHGQEFIASGKSGAYFRLENKYHSTNAIYKGHCKILKFDTINNIASGTFEFEAISEDSQVVNVTGGRFDISFKNYK